MTHRIIAKDECLPFFASRNKVRKTQGEKGLTSRHTARIVVRTHKDVTFLVSGQTETRTSAWQELLARWDREFASGRTKIHGRFAGTVVLRMAGG